jgi:hypothetical protein
VHEFYRKFADIIRRRAVDNVSLPLRWHAAWIAAESRTVVHQVAAIAISRKKPFMATPLHILGISGSLHKKSHTTAVLHAVQQLLPEDVTWKYSPGPNTDVQR